MLSRMDLAEVRRFLADPDRFRVAPPTIGTRPSDAVVHHLEERGFVTRRAAARPPVAATHEKGTP
jgi:hypothetical protein